VDYLMNAAKVLAVLAALLALRFAVQLAVRRKGGLRPLRAIAPFALPPLITGGPGFVGLATFILALRDPSLPPYLAWMALLGGVGLAVGLAAMFGVLTGQQKRIARLEELLADRKAEAARRE
jgi:hypothetical protein